jgi:hypothetical protein
MGFNPEQRHRIGPADYAMLIGASVVAVALVFWALLS